MRNNILIILTMVNILGFETMKKDSVYLCMGNYSHAYHKYPNCKGLHNCSTSLKKVSLFYATHKYKRVHCGYER